MEQLRQYLGDSVHLIDALVRITRRVCAVNVRRFEPRLGDDAFVIGSMNWRNLLAAYEYELPALVAGLKVARPNNHMVLTLENGIRVRPYSTHLADGQPTFRADSKTKAMLSSRNSISFFEYASSFKPADFPAIEDLVFLYDADMYEGLRAMYAGAPLSIDPSSTEDASGWFFCETIYRRDPSASDDDIDEGGAPVVPGPVLPIQPFSERATPEIGVEPREEKRPTRADTRGSLDDNE